MPRVWLYCVSTLDKYNRHFAFFKMKIFAYHLCLQLQVSDENPFYDVPLHDDWDAFSLAFASAFDGQTFFVRAVSEISFVLKVFEFQTIEENRNKNCTVVLRFKDKAEREVFKEMLKQQFKKEKVAGGIVQNEHLEYLLIYTRGKWTFPKGHVEKEEEIQHAAIREVKEETGLQEVHITEPIGKTIHTFLKKDKWRWKTTYWYRMYAPSNQVILPQAEESIEAVEWISKEKWIQDNLKSYPLSKELLVREFVKNVANKEKNQ